MSFFKRISTLALAVMLAVTFAACGNGNNTSSQAPSSEAPASTPEQSTEPASSEAPVEVSGDISIDVFIYDYSDTYIASVRQSMEDGFASANLNATFYDAGSDQGAQTQQIETAVTRGSDLLVVNIVTTGSEEAAMNIVELAQSKDIPLIFFNREVSNDVVNSYDKCVFVGTDADEAGYMQGELIFDILSTDFSKYDLNGDGSISYIMFKGELGNAEADGRTKYSVEEADRLLEGAGLGTLVYYDSSNSDMFQPCNWSSAEAQDSMATALGTNPFSGNNPIELVIANNDDMALGAIEALNEMGYNIGYDEDGNLPDPYNYIPVVGVDATVAAQDAVGAAKMDGTIKQDAEGMANCIVSLAGTVSGGGSLIDGTASYNVDEGVYKIRIPYAKYTG